MADSVWQRLRGSCRNFWGHLVKAKDLTLSPHALSRAQKAWLFAGETIHAVNRHQTFTLASALAFKTLLSVVPLLLIGLAVSMTLGTENGVSYADSFLNAIEGRVPQVAALQPLLELLRDLARRPREIAGIGFIMLFYMAYSLLASIDWCINYIWQVETPRPLLNRLISYFLIIIIVPVLMSLAVAANSQIASFVDVVAEQIDSVRNSILNVAGASPAPPGGKNSLPLTRHALTLLSALITCAALAVLIKLMPNTRVRWRAAICGGLAGGVLIELTRYFFGLYTAHAAKNLTQLYGSTLLFIPLTLLWLWITWAFVLLGAEFAFAQQNYHNLALRAQIAKQGLHHRIYIALRLLVLIARDFVAGVAPRPQIDATATELGVPPFVVEAVARDLTRQGILRETVGGEECFLPGKDLSALTVLEVVNALQRDELATLPGSSDPAAGRITAAFSAVRGAADRELGSLTLKDLVD